MKAQRAYGVTALVVVGLTGGGLRPARAIAQGTRQWTVSRYEDFERGQPEGVAIRNDGRLEAGPTVSPLYAAAAASYVWSLARDTQGRTYAGLGGSTGGSAAVVQVGADGSANTLFAGKELGVQSVRLGPDGSAYAATSPDGRVYRLGAGQAAKTGASPGGERIVFDPSTTAEKPRYLWDMAVADDGTIFVATGAPAVVYAIPPGSAAKARVLFRTADQHIRSLLLARDGTLWAGSDGSGVIYRINTKQHGATPFAAYASAHREITALALDTAGNLYAAAVGAKGPSTLPPLPVTGSVGVTVTFVQPGSATAAGSNGVVPDGSEIDRIANDGTPQRLLTLKDDVVYALALQGTQLLAATGNRGRIYRLDPAVSGRLTELARVDAGQATAMIEDGDRLVVGTSNAGKLLQLRNLTGASTYRSEIFDAGQYARWGRVELQADSPGVNLSLRTGNVPNAIQGWSDWSKVGVNGEVVPVLPAGRFVQWKADLRTGAALDAVTLNYLPRNVAPVVDDVVVAPGARVASPGLAAQQPSTVQVVFLPAAGSATQAGNLIQTDVPGGPLTAQKDRSAITVRWAAHDDNGDDLVFALFVRGLGEANWRLLKDNISDRFLSFDSSLLPDGRYQAKVMASDAPVHADGETLSGERASGAFLVDTTPPVPDTLAARSEGGKVHWSLEASDAISPIAHAEYSLDAGPWQYVEPVGGLSDSRSERYDATVDLPAVSSLAQSGAARPAEHVLAVRIYDRADNMTSIKTVVH